MSVKCLLEWAFISTVILLLVLHPMAQFQWMYPVYWPRAWVRGKARKTVDSTPTPGAFNLPKEMTYEPNYRNVYGFSNYHGGRTS